MAAPPIDPNAYNYGGKPGEAERQSKDMMMQAGQAQGRTGSVIDTGQTNQDRGNAGDARGAQLRMADMMYRRASGATPSIAGMQADRQMGQAAAEQSSAAASARGPAAMALAQQGAAANTAAMQGNISNQAQINSAQERMQAEQAAYGAYSGLRSGDQGQQGLDAQGAQAQAQINAAQRAQNDQYTLGQQGQAIGVNGMQMGGQMNRDAAQQSQYFNEQQLQQQKDAADRANTMGWVSAGASLAATAASFASDERTKVPVTWGTGNDAAPPGHVLAPSTWGTGRGTTDVDMSRMLAHQALAEQSDRENAAHTRDMQTGGGPMAVAGMSTLRQRDSEDLGLMQAKERNGIKLTDREQESKASLQHRAGQEKVAAAAAKDGAKAEKPAADPTAGDKVAGVASGISKALAPMAQAPAQTYHYVPAATHSINVPQFQYAPAAQANLGAPMMRSDEKTKDGGGSADFSTGARSAGGAITKALAPLATPPAQTYHYTPPEHHDVNTMTSDERTKAKGEWLDRNSDNAVGMDYLYAPPGTELHADGLKRSDSAGATKAEASLSGPVPKYSNREVGTELAPSERAAKEKPAVSMASRVAPKRKMSVAEAERLLGQMGEQNKALLDAGPAVRQDPMANANRAMAAAPYAYKPEFAAAEGQAPGEKNVGPMAQNMAADPVAATAVKEDPSTGLLSLDKSKMLKLTAGGVASLQDQVDQQQQQIASMADLLRSRK